MKRLLRAALCMGVFGAGMSRAEVPWAGTLNPAEPGPFPMVQPFTGEFRFGWSNIDAARATARFSREGERMRVEVEGGTTGLARRLWQLDARNTTIFSVPGLRSAGFEQFEKYARRTVSTQVEWKANGVWRLRDVEPGGKDEKWKRVKVEPLRDMVTGMVFVRSQKLEDGDKVRLLVYPGDTPFLAEISVLGRETLRIGGKELRAIKLDFRPKRIVRDEKGKYSLQPHGKFTRGVVWVSDDKYRMPLRAEVYIFIGYVFGELEWAKFADGSMLP